MTKEQILYIVWNWTSGYADNYADNSDKENTKSLAYISGVCDMAERVMKIMDEEGEADENKEDN